MKLAKVLVLIVVAVCFTNCTIKERIVFNEDGSGNYLLNYNMAEFMKQMQSQMGASASAGNKEAVDTVMVFKDIMETYKDSVAALPDEKRMALEAVKDMYMKMSMDEEKGVFDFGIGLNFKAITDLADIGEKIAKVKTLNAQSDQVNAMKSSPMGKFMGDDMGDTKYDYTNSTFSRVTTLPDTWNAEELQFDATDETDKQFMEYFESAYYIVEYTFPKKIKRYSVDSAELSNNDKTITYKVSWMDFLKNPKVLDVDLTFADE